MCKTWNNAENETLGIDPSVVSQPHAASVLIQPPKVVMLPSRHEKLLYSLSPVELYGDSWEDLNVTHLQAYIGLLILTGVSKTKCKAMAPHLGNADTGRGKSYALRQTHSDTGCLE